MTDISRFPILTQFALPPEQRFAFAKYLVQEMAWPPFPVPAFTMMLVDGAYQVALLFCKKESTLAAAESRLAKLAAGRESDAATVKARQDRRTPKSPFFINSTRLPSLLYSVRIVVSGTARTGLECSEGSGTPSLARGDSIGVDCGRHEHQGGDFMSSRPNSEVFAALTGGFFHDTVGAQPRFSAETSRSVIERSLYMAGVIVFAWFLRLGAIFGDAASECDAFGDAGEGGEDVLANFFLVVGSSELKMHVIGMMLYLVPPWIEPTVTTADRRENFRG